MHEKLNHLDKKQIEELMNRYYFGVGETASKLIEEYEIDIQASRLYTLFPNTVCEEVCKWCESQLEMPPISKTAMNSRWSKREKICPKCGHSDTSRVCYCEECKLERERMREEEERKKIEYEIFQRQKIHEAYRRNADALIGIDEMTFLDRVYLGAILRGFLSEDLTTIKPIQAEELSPDGRISADMVRSLIYKKILVVDETSDIQAFVDDDTFPNTYYTFRVKYNLNLIMPPNKSEFLKSLMYPKVLREEDKEQAYEFWKKLALEECIQYLIYQLKQVKFEFSPGDKTYAVFEELLEYYSVSQIYGIIWKKVSDATRLYQEGGISKKHAANTVIGGCQTYGERARINNWDLRKYSRLKELPQSIISEFFFNQVLHIGDMGFNMPPTLP